MKRQTGSVEIDAVYDLPNYEHVAVVDEMFVLAVFKMRSVFAASSSSSLGLNCCFYLTSE